MEELRDYGPAPPSVSWSARVRVKADGRRLMREEPNPPQLVTQYYGEPQAGQISILK